MYDLTREVPKHEIDEFIQSAREATKELGGLIVLMNEQEEKELAELRRLIPMGSTGCWSKYGGECLSCGLQRPASRMLNRYLFVDEDGEIRGPKVCRGCSPHIADDTVYKFTLEIEDWQDRWLRHLDSNAQVFDGVVVCVN